MNDWGILIQQLLNGLTLGSIYGLVAIGYSLVYGIIGMINFAHGDLYMIGVYLAAIGFALCSLFGITSFITVLSITLILTMIITGMYGLSLERLAYRPLRNASRLAPLISAIGMSIILENFVQLSQGSRSQAIPVMLNEQLKIELGSYSIHISAIQLLIIMSTFISVSILTLIIAKTSLGRSMRAAEQDKDMAEILGVDPNKIIPFVFVLGAVMAGGAGVLITLNYGSFDFTIGFMVGIKAFTSAVLGGIGSLPGAMLGGLILGLAETLFAGFVDVGYKDVFAFSLLIIVLIFKPNGLLGTQPIAKI